MQAAVYKCSGYSYVNVILSSFSVFTLVMFRTKFFESTGKLLHLIHTLSILLPVAWF